MLLCCAKCNANLQGPHHSLCILLSSQVKRLTVRPFKRRLWIWCPWVLWRHCSSAIIHTSQPKPIVLGNIRATIFNAPIPDNLLFASIALHSSLASRRVVHGYTWRTSISVALGRIVTPGRWTFAPPAIILGHIDFEAAVQLIRGMFRSVDTKSWDHV